jgi:hypothetical protein
MVVLIRNGTGVDAVEAEFSRSLGLTLKELLPILRRGGDAAEKRFMECCWCLWKANGSELVEPFIEAAFNILPKKSRSVLFARMLTIVYVAQDSVVKRPTV